MSDCFDVQPESVQRSHCIVLHCYSFYMLEYLHNDCHDASFAFQLRVVLNLCGCLISLQFIIIFLCHIFD